MLSIDAMSALVTGQNGRYSMSLRKHHWMWSEDNLDGPIVVNKKRRYLILINSHTFERRLMIHVQTEYTHHWVYLPGNVMQSKRFIKALR